MTSWNQNVCWTGLFFPAVLMTCASAVLFRFGQPPVFSDVIPDQPSADLFLVTDYRQAAHHVLKFTDIARPRIFPQQILRFFREIIYPVISHRGFRQKLLRQRHNIVPALSQRRNLQSQHINSKIKITAEVSLFHHAYQIPVRRRDHADIDRRGFLSTDTADRPLLQNP